MARQAQARRRGGEGVAPEIPDKVFFRIGEVTELTGVDAHVLRFWEAEFRQLEPTRSRTGQRLYQQRDVRTVLRLKDLLWVRRFTLEGAKAELGGGGRNAQQSLPIAEVGPTRGDGATAAGEPTAPADRVSGDDAGWAAAERVVAERIAAAEARAIAAEAGRAAAEAARAESDARAAAASAKIAAAEARVREAEHRAALAERTALRSRRQTEAGLRALRDVVAAAEQVRMRIAESNEA